MSEDISLSSIAARVQSDFEGLRPILSFDQFLGIFREQPRRFARDAVQYLRDCFEYFGRQSREEVWGDVHHFNLFDAPFDEGRGRLIGQELAQIRVVKLLEGFVRQGRVNKLILLHGPNGSAKSTLVNTMMRALEAYSKADEGALYRFNWVFPNEKLASGSSIGFGGFNAKLAESSSLETFAFLEEDQINAKIASDLNDHPLLLIPAQERAELLRASIDGHVEGGSDEALQADGDDERVFVLSEYMLRGDLSHTSRQIFDALMTAYRGDLTKVLKHVQVERFYVSRRYRVGAVTVEPQMRVDAGIRQLTVDRSLSALPSSLQNQTLFEPFGDLVDANRGIIEYDDLFKRHPDLNKYLLATSEKGTVSLETRILHLDTVLVATGNEDYLDAFKQTPDYVSFKGRVELVRVPYILNYDLENEIYDDQLRSPRQLQHVAPHTTYIAALWAVLTRLKRPKPDLYDKQVRDMVSKLSPLEKADLYARGRIPRHVSPDRARELRSIVPDLMAEGDATSEYEGRRGASPREMKMILVNASQNEKFPHLSPLAVFEELDALVRDPSVFPFLQMKPDGEFHRHDQFIDTVRLRYLDILDDEVRDAMGLVESTQYDDLFSKYVDHVSQSLKKEKVYNRITGHYEQPDEKFMQEIEELVGAADPDEFRQALISSIAAYSIDHPGEKFRYQDVFPNLFESMKSQFYEERQKTVKKILEQAIDYFDGKKRSLSSSEIKMIEATLENMRDRFGYNEASAREAIAFLRSSRYKD